MVNNSQAYKTATQRVLKSIRAIFILFIFLLAIHYSTEARESNILKVLLIAGPNDHCDDSEPCHKYIEDMEIIRQCLLQQEGLEVDLLIGERPQIGSLEDIDVVVIHAASDDTESEWNALFPRLNQKKQYKDKDYMSFLNYFDHRIDEGMGLVVLHYATSVNHRQSVRKYKKWIGGYFDDKTSLSDGDTRTQETFVALEAVKLKSPEHPVLRGIEPWKSEAEYYYNLKILDSAIPILTSDLPINQPNEEVIAWAFERTDGGRGFGFTGGHNHNNMYLENFRKFILNIIYWTGRADVPESGVQSDIGRE